MWPDTIYSNYLTTIRRSVLFSRWAADHLADRIPLGGKTFLILCHNVPGTKQGIRMKVICAQIDPPAFLLCLAECKVKKCPVVRLELQPSVRSENLSVPPEKGSPGKPSFGVAVLRPGI